MFEPRRVRNEGRGEAEWPPRLMHWFEVASLVRGCKGTREGRCGGGAGRARVAARSSKGSGEWWRSARAAREARMSRCARAVGRQGGAGRPTRGPHGCMVKGRGYECSARMWRRVGGRTLTTGGSVGRVEVVVEFSTPGSPPGPHSCRQACGGKSANAYVQLERPPYFSLRPMCASLRAGTDSCVQDEAGLLSALVRAGGSTCSFGVNGHLRELVQRADVGVE